MTPSEGRSDSAAFSVVDLLVIIGMLALLGMCILPALARTKTDTRAYQCLNNHSQLMRACRMYADDSNDKFPGNMHGTGVNQNDPRRPWVQGWLDWSVSSANTNEALLLDPRYASLAAYFGNQKDILKCPSDIYLSPVQRARGWSGRVRSLSANVYIGNTQADINLGPSDPSLLPTTKFSQLSNPSPALSFIYLDENADSMNDRAFFAPASSYWYDMPANYHDGGVTISFADGRAEIHRWQSSVLPIKIISVSGFSGIMVNPSTDLDYLWLRQRVQHQPGAPFN